MGSPRCSGSAASPLITNFFAVIDKIQPRKPKPDNEPPNGLARRATDHEFRGMKIDEDDSDQAWADFEEALKQVKPADEEPTQPGDLN